MNAAAAKREMEEAAASRQAAVDKLAVHLGKRYAPVRANLDSFSVYHAQQRAVLKQLRDIIPALSAFIADGRGLMFFGSVGTGKDHLMAAMLYQAAALGATCRWVNGQELYGRIRDNIDTHAPEAAIFSDLSAPTVLAISDPIPPTGDATQNNLQQLCRLLDRRYRELRPTWITMNALSPDDADQKLSAPVFDRLRDGAEFLRCFWPSYRERAAAQQVQQTKEKKE